MGVPTKGDSASMLDSGVIAHVVGSERRQFRAVIQCQAEREDSIPKKDSQRGVDHIVGQGPATEGAFLSAREGLGDLVAEV